MGITLTIPGSMYSALKSHLFPGDHEEHGAVIAAGIARGPQGVRLLARDLFVARDGIDYVPSPQAHRMLRADFVRDQVMYCRDEKLCYLAIHNHGGERSVGFSSTDLQSHERGYPALLQVTRGQPVGALVFATDAVAGDIWFQGRRMELGEATVIGPAIRRLSAAPRADSAFAPSEYDRQTRLFGDVGQALLGKAKVGIIGAGGVGSLISEYLAHLGVGHIVIVDPQRLDITNRSRVVGSTRWDNMTWLLQGPGWVRRFAEDRAMPKVRIARRLARRANPDVRFDALHADFLEEQVAREFIGCDFLFLAADTMQARLLFNAMVHQYLIPGAQIGSKVVVDKASGAVQDVYSVARPVTPDSGCLWCNGFISPAGLQSEALTSEEREAQRYIDDPSVTAPNVITLNANGVGQAANDFLFSFVGLTRDDARQDYIRVRPQRRDVVFEHPRADADCPECSHVTTSRRGRGDSQALPVRPDKGRRAA